MSSSTNNGEAHGRKHFSLRFKLALAACACLMWGALANLYCARYWPIDDMYLELDPARLYRVVPGSRCLAWLGARNGSRYVLSSFDSLGFRGPELAPRTAARKRVAVYGDSFVAALETELRQTFVVCLGNELERRGLAVEMVNAGVTGYGPDQALLRLEEEIDALAPDLVVLAICAQNDFADLTRNRMFLLDAHGALRASGAPALQPFIERFAERERIARLPALVRVFRHALSRVRESIAAPDEPARPLLEEKARWWRACGYYADASGHPPPGADSHDPAVVELSLRSRAEQDLLRALFERCARVCARHSCALAIVVVPAALDVIDDRENEQEARGYAGYARETMSRAYARLAHDSGIPCLDFFDAFRARGGAALYRRANDPHWNETGQSLAAELTTEFVLARELLAAPHR